MTDEGAGRLRQPASLFANPARGSRHVTKEVLRDKLGTVEFDETIMPVMEVL